MKHEKISPVPPEDLPATPATGLTEEEAARRAEMGLDNRHKADAGQVRGADPGGKFLFPVQYAQLRPGGLPDPGGVRTGTCCSWAWCFPIR